MRQLRGKRPGKTVNIEATVYARLSALSKRTGIPVTVMVRRGCEEAAKMYEVIAARGWDEDGVPCGGKKNVDSKPSA